MLAFFLTGETLAGLWRATYSHFLERLVFHSLLGLLAVAGLTTALAFAGAIYPATGWLILAGLYLISAKTGLRLWREFSQTQGTFNNIFQRDETDRWFSGFNIGVLALLTVLAVILAMAPPVKTDALVYHLAIPKAYLENHGVIPLPNSMYSFFPLLFEMVFLFAMMFGVESLPALCGLAMSGLLMLGMAVYYRLYLSRRGVWLVPVLYFCTPTFFEISASAYIDLALAGFMFFTFYAWDRWRETRLPFWFGYMVVAAGATWATKLTGMIILPLVALGIALEGRRDPDAGRVIRRLLIFGGVVLLFMAPWWIRNFQFSGNPFLPLLMPLLGGEDRVNWDPGRAVLFDQYVKMFGMGRGILDLLLLPYNLTFHAQPHSLKFDGRIGIAYFLLIPALIAALRRPWDSRIKAMALVFVIWMMFWFIYFQYVRFLAPPFTLLVLLGALGLDRLTSALPSSLRWSRALLPAAVAGGILYNLTLIGGFWQKLAPWKPVTGQETRDAYLERHIRSYPLYRAMNQLDPEARVLFVYMRNLGYLAEREFLSDSIFEAHTLQKILDRDGSVEGIRRQLKTLGITHFMFDESYVFGSDSAFPPIARLNLKDFLKQRAERVHQEKGYFLYQLRLD
ncbi:MAG: hypothetical protein GWO19_15570 [Nitrospinaceae bacterium]|nr:hypothetical protein [Nitrospinaceae bacterium]NIR55814.1 hypothetical protein [Nitrospinaceae bacterium]NIS86267.1 hypothetical protein [Nitrospinaceae bacterium]NIU45306.1 hypothetical protein [Nitrospinaceae bacterium]NIU95379.1 hypothetical protein [Nitrospinaceae bacterium]